MQRHHPVSADETGEPYFALLVAIVRQAQNDVIQPTSLGKTDDAETIRQDAIEFLEWLPQLQEYLRDEVEEQEVIREATTERWVEFIGYTEKRTKRWNLDSYWTR